MGSGRCGVDIGPSTAATVSETDCSLKVLAPEAESIEREQRILLRKMDRSRRVMNPDNYNPDGTVRKDPKRWKKSNTYKETERGIRICAGNGQILSSKAMNGKLTG